MEYTEKNKTISKEKLLKKKMQENLAPWKQNIKK